MAFQGTTEEKSAASSDATEEANQNPTEKITIAPDAPSAPSQESASATLFPKERLDLRRLRPSAANTHPT